VSINSVGSDQSQSIGSLLLQQLNASNGSAQDANGLSNALGDLLTLSPAAQQLTKAPDAVTQAMADLFSGQKDVSGDLAQLKAYFQQNPQSLTSVLSSLQGGTATYGASGGQGSNAALLTALMNGQSKNTDAASLLSLLNGGQNQDSLFSFMGDSSSGSDGSSLSIFG
jgi:hypothetical protein